MGIFDSPTSYGDEAFSRYMRRIFLASAGYDAVDTDARPVVAIADTSSDYVTCHREMPQLVQAVRRGVLEAGGLPMVFPTTSLGEILISPTSMLYRNLMAMDTEEMIRGYPMDAVVLVGGCDKTVPAQLMAAASVNVPAIMVVTGPMRTGSWHGERLGACTDCRRYWARHRAGELDDEEMGELEQHLATTAGTCMVMGTASTMACLAEALGMMLPGGATAVAGTGDRLRQAVASGRRAVDMARAGDTTARVLTPAAFANAQVVLAALAGSTNAVIHLLAIAGRAGVRLTLDSFDEAAQRVPVLVDCKPVGAGYLEDLHQSGGVPALLQALRPLLDESAWRVDGCTVGTALAKGVPKAWDRTLRTLSDPVHPGPAFAVLHGSLAPDGGVLKVAAASPHLLRHRGPALVIDSPEEAVLRLDDPAVDVTPEHVVVLRNAGPVACGMPEAGSTPIPKRLAERGVRDMVRVSDGRMSGTAFGTTVLHCSPEAATGGPLALVHDGDIIELNVEGRRLDLLVDGAELSRRRTELRLPSPPPRGWLRLHHDHVMPAHLGADLDFLARHDRALTSLS